FWKRSEMGTIEIPIPQSGRRIPTNPKDSRAHKFDPENCRNKRDSPSASSGSGLRKITPLDQLSPTLSPALPLPATAIQETRARYENRCFQSSAEPGFPDRESVLFQCLVQAGCTKRAENIRGGGRT